MNKKAKTRRLGFIGAGNMAGALIRGLLRSGLYQKSELGASDLNRERLLDITRETGIHRYDDNLGLVQASTAVILSVKPQVLSGVLEEIRAEIRPDQLVISIAAGIPLALLGESFGPGLPLIRVMPNTPALIGAGMSALARGEKASEEHLAIAEAIFEAVGETIVVDEGMMDAVTAVSGSGPGYVFRIMEAMVDGGAAVGFDHETATRLVVQTFLGSALLAAESDRSLGELREMVTSPGGTTAAGLAVLENRGMAETMKAAVRAARDRAVTLGRGE